MSDVELTFLQDLAAHGTPKDNDLLLVNTDGDDKTLTLKKLAEYISFQSIYPVGIVTWFAQNKNPNDLFPGSKWSYIGEDKVIRLAKEDGSDLMLTGGSDTVSLKTENLPAHGHAFSANTSSFDYGEKTTSSAGYHAHNYERFILGQGSTGFVGGSASRGESVTRETSGNSEHVHTVSGTTANTGSGTAFSVKNAFVRLMAWYRIS